jgi:hypothetical protein
MDVQLDLRYHHIMYPRNSEANSIQGGEIEQTEERSGYSDGRIARLTSCLLLVLLREQMTDSRHQSRSNS